MSSWATRSEAPSWLCHICLTDDIEQNIYYFTLQVILYYKKKIIIRPTRPVLLQVVYISSSVLPEVCFELDSQRGWDSFSITIFRQPLFQCFYCDFLINVIPEFNQCSGRVTSCFFVEMLLALGRRIKRDADTFVHCTYLQFILGPTL